MEGGAIRWLSLWIKQEVSSTLWITSFFTVIHIVWIMASSLEIGQCNWWYYFQVSRLTSHQIMYPSTTFMITALEIVQCLKSPFLAQCTEAELRWGKKGVQDGYQKRGKTIFIVALLVTRAQEFKKYSHWWRIELTDYIVGRGQWNNVEPDLFNFWHIAMLTIFFTPFISQLGNVRDSIPLKIDK